MVSSSQGFSLHAAHSSWALPASSRHLGPRLSAVCLMQGLSQGAVIGLTLFASCLQCLEHHCFMWKVNPVTVVLFGLEAKSWLRWIQRHLGPVSANREGLRSKALFCGVMSWLFFYSVCATAPPQHIDIDSYSRTPGPSSSAMWAYYVKHLNRLWLNSFPQKKSFVWPFLPHKNMAPSGPAW